MILIVLFLVAIAWLLYGNFAVSGVVVVIALVCEQAYKKGGGWKGVENVLMLGMDFLTETPDTDTDTDEIAPQAQAIISADMVEVGYCREWGRLSALLPADQILILIKNGRRYIVLPSDGQLKDDPNRVVFSPNDTLAVSDVETQPKPQEARFIAVQDVATAANLQADSVLKYAKAVASATHNVDNGIVYKGKKTYLSEALLREMQQRNNKYNLPDIEDKMTAV